MASNHHPDDLYPDDQYPDDGSVEISDSEMEFPTRPPQVRWGTMEIPEAVDKTGNVVEWSKAYLQSVEPYVDPLERRPKGGSGILDTIPATHHYITPARLQDAPKMDPELAEKRRWYIVDNIDDLADDATDSESDIDPSEEGNVDRFEQSPPMLSTQFDFIKAAINRSPSIGATTTKSNLKQLSITTSSNMSTSSEKADSLLASPASTSTSSLQSDNVFNLDDLWTDLQVSVIGATLPEHVLPGESSRMSLSDCGPFSSSDALGILDAFAEVPEPEPEKPANRISDVVVKFDDDSYVRFVSGKKIIVKYAGYQATKYQSGRDNEKKVCHDILSSHRITSVVHSKNSQDTMIDWIRRSGRHAYRQYRPSLEDYLNIQDQAIRPEFFYLKPEDLTPEDRHLLGVIQVTAEDVEWIYHGAWGLISQLAQHHLLRFPLVTPLKSPIGSNNLHVSEKLADSVFRNQIAERNLTISQLVKRIYIDSKRSEAAHRRDWANYFGAHVPYRNRRSDIPEEAALVDEWQRSEHVECPRDWDHHGAQGGRESEFDLQNIDWVRKLGIRRGEMAVVRHSTYKAWDDIGGIERAKLSPVPRDRLPETLHGINFVPKAMHSAHRSAFSHYQLRNMVACRDHLQLVYANGPIGKVYTTLPYNSSRRCVIDFSNPSNATPYAEPVRFSSLGLSTDLRRSIVVAGGFDGELAVKNLDSEYTDVGDEDNGVIFEWATKNNLDMRGAINHIDVDVHANRGQLQAVMSCNDRKIRTYDIQTGTWLHSPGKENRSEGGTNSGWSYPWAVNCTAACPDGKLRVIVGDTPDVAIISTDTGRCERLLKGHFDFGFACAWSPDCLQVATANQDKIVNVYDTRTWRIIGTWASQGAGYRSLKFSPVGGGPKALLCVEPADRVTVVNALGYGEANTQNFFGEIAGADWIADGSGFWVGNSDATFGGFMEYERRGWGSPRGLDFQLQREMEEAGAHWVEEGPDEWIPEDDRWKDPRVVDPGRKGRAGNWWRDNMGDGWLDQ